MIIMPVVSMYRHTGVHYLNKNEVLRKQWKIITEGWGHQLQNELFPRHLSHILAAENKITDVVGIPQNVITISVRYTVKLVKNEAVLVFVCIHEQSRGKMLVK